MADWYYGKDNEQQGPVSELEMRSLISTGKITPDTIIWCEGMSDWLPLSQVPEFQSNNDDNTALSVYATPQTQVDTTPQYYAAPPTDGMATASLICGILSLVLCGLFSGIPAVICGHISLSRIKSSPVPMSGRGMAIGGLVTGYICIGLTIAIIIFYVFLFAAVASSAAASP